MDSRLQCFIRYIWQLCRLTVQYRGTQLSFTIASRPKDENSGVDSSGITLCQISPE